MSIPRLAALSVGSSLLLLLAVLVHDGPAGAQAEAAVLRAQAIELVDSSGRVRA